MTKDSSLSRILDANLNRLREGIRVVEDIFRYLYNDSKIAYELKSIRHLARDNNYIELLKSRDSINDCLKVSSESELNRSSLDSILIANFKRAEESARVLEELYKLSDIKQSDNFKSIRYRLYSIEKDALLKIDEVQKDLKVSL
jgi:thiamine-phosphate pyrophosphorylase